MCLWNKPSYSTVFIQRHYGVKEWLWRLSYSVLDLLRREGKKCSSTSWYILPINSSGIHSRYTNEVGSNILIHNDINLHCVNYAIYI